MTLTEKIEQIVIPSLRKGLEMEENITSGNWGSVGDEIACEVTCGEDYICILADPKDSAFIAHARNEWRKVILTNILICEELLRDMRDFHPLSGEYDMAKTRLQSIANLWPNEV